MKNSIHLDLPLMDAREKKRARLGNMASITMRIANARNDEMSARHLVQHPEEVCGLHVDKQWGRLVPFAELVVNDVPKDLIFTDPALCRTLRKAITEIRCRGLALNPQKLRELERQRSIQSLT